MKTQKQKVHIKTVHGYTVVFVPSPIEVVVVRASVYTGFIHETKKTAGVHHLLEHVIYNGWKPCHDKCILFWDKQGGSSNATTDMTVVSYYVKGLPEMTDTMIDYISTLVATPRISESVMQREKKAIISELATAMNSPHYKLKNAFNQFFYIPEGLRYGDDAAQHMKNISSLTVHDLKEAHRVMYTPSNVVFVVYGSFSMSRILRRMEDELTNSNPKVSPLITCFSKRHDFVYVHTPTQNFSIMVGFPLSSFCQHPLLYSHILKALLFDALRTTHDLIYSIHPRIEEDHCSSRILIQFDCMPHAIQSSLHVLFRTLYQYTHRLMNKDTFNGIQRRTIYHYRTDYPYDMYYSSYLYTKKPLFTKDQLIRHTRSLTIQHFLTFMKQSILFETCTLAYQGPHKIPCTWDTFLKIDTHGTYIPL